jgi:heme/copper-type cytochrome/quinol oxidase subunit 4
MVPDERLARADRRGRIIGFVLAVVIALIAILMHYWG